MNKNKKVAVIILAGGSGTRFGGGVPKQFINLNGRPIIEYSIKAFRNSGLCDHIAVVCHKDWLNGAWLKHCRSMIDVLVAGGTTRNESTKIGLSYVPRNTEYILTHDAIRPFIDVDTIRRCVAALADYEAVDTSIPIADTVIEIDGVDIIGIPERISLRRGQTPQGFRYDSIIKGYERVPKESTDDIGVLFKDGIHCATVEGSEWNIKITTPVDLFIAEKILQFRNAQLISPTVGGKTILVFGGSGGIGSEVAKQLSSMGANVIAPPRSMVDLSKDELPQFLYESNYDCIVNCAGVVYKGLDNYDEVMNVNFRSALLVVDLAMKTMSKGGNIVFVGSSSALKGRKETPIYSASKAALNNFTEAIADYLITYGINVNCINPARTNTKMTDFLGTTGDDSLAPEYVAKIIVGYCSTSYTGQIVNIRKNVKGDFDVSR